MKIGIVLSKTPGYSETFFISKIKGLQDYGHTVSLFVQHKASDFNLCDVKVAPAKPKSTILRCFSFFIVITSLLPYIKRVIKFVNLETASGETWSVIIKKMYLNAHLLKANVDWLHFGFATLALGKENLAKAVHTKMAISVRGFDICIYPVKYPNCYDLLWQRVDKVHAISEDLILRLKDAGLPNTIPVEKITPAIDTSIFKKPSVNTKVIDNDVLSIISVARLHWKKGFLYTLEALAKLKKQGVKFHYTIVGDGNAYEEIVYAIHQLDLTDSVTLVGKKSRTEIIALYNASEVFIQYSITEGFCNAVLEAQAMGLLCVVSDAEGLAENVAHNESGWVVPKRDVDALVKKLMEIYKLNVTQKLKIQKEAQIRVKEFYNIELQKSKFQAFSRKI